MDSQLIYDVGANNGNDTAHYLAEGYRVVAIEANPRLCDQMARRFSRPVGDGLLTIVRAGVAPTTGTMRFFVNEVNDEHSSFDEEAGTRWGQFHVIDVSTLRFGDILAAHGVPYYLKIDIERYDEYCIRALDASDVPEYISIEAQSLEYLQILRDLGYRRFKAIDQSTLNSPHIFDLSTRQGRMLTRLNFDWCRVKRHTGLGKNPFPVASSGPFGESTSGSWRSFDEVARDWTHFDEGTRHRGTLNPRGWFDFHAAR